ncbi:TPA: methyltransferase domain-containing protein, partial [Pseudomonas putida]|nr:methyltransferase domain-containing protein [Pseudomonas putida]
MNNTTLEKPTVNNGLLSPLADIHDRVMEAYYGKLGEQFMRETQARIHWICAQIKGRKILDVGCSQGVVPLLLAREGCQVTGVDTSPQAIEEAKGYLSTEPAHVQQNVTYINSDFLLLDKLEVEPDTIVISEVLEHLVRPELFVEKANDLLKQGGRLVITVPFGVNDFIDHKHTFYLMEPFRLLAEHLQITEIKMLGKWLGIVAQKTENHQPGIVESLAIERVLELEKAFEYIERNLRENLGAISKRLEEANKKYRTATEQITQLKPEAQKAEALSRQLQTRDADIATLRNANREILEAKSKNAQELEDIRLRLDEANKKYRVVTEQAAALRTEAQKAEALAHQLQARETDFAALEASSRESLHASAHNIQALSEELDSLKSALGEANQNCLTAAEQYAQLEQQFATLEVAHLQSLTEAEQRLSELQGQHDQTREALSAASDDLEQLTEQKRVLQDDLHVAGNKSLALEEQLLATQAQLQVAQQNADEQANRLEHISASLNQREGELETLQQVQRTTDEQLQATVQLRTAAETRASEKAAKIAELQAQQEALDGQLQALSEQQTQILQDNATHIDTITYLRARQAAIESELENRLQEAAAQQEHALQASAAQADSMAALREQ